MKKILLFLAASISLISAARSQPSFTVLQTLDTTYYEDLKEVSPAYIAGLGYGANYRIDLRTNTGNDFGTIFKRFTIGDTTSYFSRLEPVGNYIYACGFNLQAINVTNPSAPVLGPISTVGSFHSAAHWGSMFYIYAYDRFRIYSLANPLIPVQVDSLMLTLQSADFRIWQNKLYYLESDTGAGNRLYTYSLSTTPPYMTLSNTLVINPRSPFDSPIMDISDNHLFVKTVDTMYDFRIDASGSLNLSSKRASAFWAFNIVAKDSAVLCYAGYQRIEAQSLETGAISLIDTTDRFTFNSFRNIGRLGNNIFYSELVSMTLISLRDNPVSIGQVPASERSFVLYPNPAFEHWVIDSKKAGVFTLYATDGRLITSESFIANEHKKIPARNLPAGNYYFRINANDGTVSSGKLMKY